MDGKLADGGLIFPPPSGYLTTGEPVIGYDTLMNDNAELRCSEGWKTVIYAETPVDDNYREVYTETETEILVSYEIMAI